MAINLKKNNIDDLFLNLTENPQGLENKDFRLQLSTIYQLFEDEFEDVFVGKNTPLRGTDFYLLDNGEFFVTPTNNFEFYCPTKVIFGKDTISELASNIDKSKKILSKESNKKLIGTSKIC